MGSVADHQPDNLNIYDMALMKKEDLDIGRISELAGYAARRYVEQATELALAGTIEAIVTLPINKEATRLSDNTFTGHTELIAGMCGQSNYTMMLASDKLIVTHVSTHVPLKTAIEHLQADRIYNVIRLTEGAVRKLRSQTRIAVAGLNPHAGEHGAFGREDIAKIQPAVERAQSEGLEVYGPLPPDTVFLQTINGHYDAVVAMYHDQGHIPMKLLAFDKGVNVTLGLQIIRTSVDHGTAYDIAYQGIASTSSFRAACQMALQLAGASNSR
jgi:4-hydroxythreonine-4-phosphate dehydrogenase